MRETEAMRDFFNEKSNKIFSSLQYVNANEIKQTLNIDDNNITLSYGDIRVSANAQYYEAIPKLLKLLRREIISKRHKKHTAEVSYEDNFKTTKEKIFVLSSMSEDDAINEMINLGHDFFLYQDIDRNNNTCLIYERNDGAFAVIETR